MKFCDERIQMHLLNDGKIKRSGADYLIYLNGNNDTVCCKHGYISVYIFKREDFTTDDWEIVEPEYNWDKIIKDKVLCVFSDDEDRGTYVISPLIKVEGKGFSFMTIEELSYSHCKPFNPADYNIAKDLKEYEK